MSEVTVITTQPKPLSHQTYIRIHNKKRRIIHLIDHSIAFTDGDGEVYINKNLKDYNPVLFDKVLEHELEHDDGSYNVEDLQHDIHPVMTFKERTDFCSKYPKALYYLSPVVITEEKVMISWLQIFMYLVWLGLGLMVLVWMVL